MISGILYEIWAVTVAASPYLLFGFLFAGIIRAFFNEHLIHRHLGKRSFKSVILASLFGVPLPLCSCGVMPVATSLRKSGASRGATTSFLISTPESGIDSIAISYALLDPVLTIIRPLAAFLTALFAGTLSNAFDKGQNNHDSENKDCGCSTGKEDSKAGIVQRIIGGIRYGFLDLLPSISLYLLQGLILAGIISYLIPDTWIQQYIGSGIKAKFIMLIIGVPLYICATSSTPIAAALILKGMSPGTALVFLLAGPATNLATMIVVKKILGKSHLIIYLLSIAFCAIVFGIGVDMLYKGLIIDPMVTVGSITYANISVYSLGSGVLLSVLLVYGIWLENIKGIIINGLKLK